MLAGESQLQGPEDPSTLITRHQLARVIAAQGRLDEAKTEYRHLLEVRTRVLGEEDPDTQATKAALEELDPN
ncbi:hypothetical protein GCM10029964_065130 [Kibdelosporangium lantanae]